MKEESKERYKGCMTDDSIMDLLDDIPIEIEVRLRASSVWGLTPFDAPKEEVKRCAENYGITYEDAMKWKEYYINIHEQDKLYEESLNVKKEGDIN